MGRTLHEGIFAILGQPHVHRNVLICIHCENVQIFGTLSYDARVLLGRQMTNETRIISTGVPVVMQYVTLICGQVKTRVSIFVHSAPGSTSV